MKAKIYKLIPRQNPPVAGGGIVLAFKRRQTLTERIRNEQNYFPTRGNRGKRERAMGDAL